LTHRIMLVAFVNSLQQIGNYTTRPFVTSAFRKHGLTAMTDVVSNIVGGVSKLPLAKFIDVVGRPQGFMLCTVCVVVGKCFIPVSRHFDSWKMSRREERILTVLVALVLMAACQNVSTFCAAQVFYWVGMNGIDYIQNVFIADTSVMQNRLIWIALTGLPYIVNTFVSNVFLSAQR
jgi:hypothetical protein